MAWGRLDDKYHSHPKTVCVSLAARGLWVTLLSWACGNDSKMAKGFLPSALVRREAASDADALSSELVSAGFWEVVTGGYLIHDFEQFQAPSRIKSDPVPPEELSAIRAEAGKLGAASRWQNNGKTMAKAIANLPLTNGKPDSKAIANTGSPVPVPDPISSEEDNARATSIRDPEPPGNPKPSRPRTAAQTDDEWIVSLISSGAYDGVNVPNQIAKCKVWCANNNRQPSRKTIVNWLNRAEVPVRTNASDSSNVPYVAKPCPYPEVTESSPMPGIPLSYGRSLGIDRFTQPRPNPAIPENK